MTRGMEARGVVGDAAEFEGASLPLLQEADVGVELEEAPSGYVVGQAQGAVLSQMEQSWSGAAHAPTNGAAQRLSERAPAIPETSPGLIQPPYPAPTSFMNIPDLPDAARWWAAQKFFMIMWMVASILVILVSGNILNFVAGILGTVGACLHVCPCCGGPQLSGPVKAIEVMAYVCLGLDSVSIVLRMVLAIGGWYPVCSEDVDYECIHIFQAILGELCVVLHLIATASAAWRAHQMRRLLNPVTAGVVVI